MPYESNTGLGVYNHYGPRTSSGTAGHVKTEGVLNEWMKEIGVDGATVDGNIDYIFLPPCDTQPSKYVVEVDLSQVTGTVTGVTIGGVDVSAATLEAPVEIDHDNTGVLAVPGATGGQILIRFKHYPPM